LPQKLNITVAGAGKGGPSMVAHLVSMGFSVKLYELPEFEHKLKPFIQRGGIECDGEVRGFFTPAAMTTDAEEAAADADIVMVAAMAMGHEAIVRNLLPHAKDGSLVAFNTGYYACLRFYPKFRRLRKRVILAETDILPYLCLRTGPHGVRIDGIKKEVGVAALPASDTPAALKLLRKTKLLRFFPRKHSLEVSLSSMNLLFHAPIVLFNMAASENTKGDYVFYRDGVSPGIGRIIHAMDAERIAIGRKVGVRLLHCVAATKRYYADYHVTGDTIDECLRTNLAYARDVFPMPSIRDFAVFRQDLAYGLPPIVELGRLLNVPTPTFRMIVDIANLACQTDYMREGLTLRKLGIAGMTASTLLRYLRTGETASRRTKGMTSC
jgi:opine dehydrogenase